MKLKEKILNLPPPIILVFGFGTIIFVGSILLCLPISSISGQSVGYLDSLFTSTSAVCVTGLAVFDPGSTLSPFGQVVLVTLIQLGGIGFMTTTSFIFMVVGKRITLRDRLLISDSFNDTQLQGVVRLTRNVLFVTAITEGIAIPLLAIRFVPMYGVGQGLFYSVFHSISAFCNAGFDVFGQNSSLIPFAGDVLINVVTMGLIITGGLGFFVVLQLTQGVRKKHRKPLSFHAKVVLVMTALLISLGFVMFLAAESSNPKTLGAANVPVSQKILGALFQSVTTRTAGFSTIPQSDMLPISKVFTTGLMFIGASPASTGGGIKTTTFAVLLLSVFSTVLGREDIEIGGRTINRKLVLRAVAVCALALALVMGVTAMLAVIEHGRISFSDIAFEITSAFGTVGLSTGITPTLSSFSKVLIIIVMYCGRVGVFTFTIALSLKLARPKANIHYPEEKLLIG